MIIDRQAQGSTIEARRIPQARKKDMSESKQETKKAPKVTKHTKEWVTIPVEGLYEVTIKATMKQRKQETFTKMRKEVNGIPFKLGATKSGFVHWKMDMKRYKQSIDKKKKAVAESVCVEKLKELMHK